MIKLVYYRMVLRYQNQNHGGKLTIVGDCFLINRKTLKLVSENQHCTIFSHIFCLKLFIDAIKPNIEKKLKTCNFNATV